MQAKNDLLFLPRYLPETVLLGKRCVVPQFYLFVYRDRTWFSMFVLVYDVCVCLSVFFVLAVFCLFVCMCLYMSIVSHAFACFIFINDISDKRSVCMSVCVCVCVCLRVCMCVGRGMVSFFWEGLPVFWFWGLSV